MTCGTKANRSRQAIERRAVVLDSLINFGLRETRVGRVASKQFAAFKVGRRLSSGRAARGNRAAGISEVNSFLSIKRVRLTAAGAEDAQRVMTAQASAPPPRPLRLRGESDHLMENNLILDTNQSDVREALPTLYIRPPSGWSIG